MLTLAIAVSVIPGDAVALSFPDVPSSYQYSTAVDYVTDQGIANGVQNGARFAPNDDVSRAELTKMLIAANVEDSAISSCIQTFRQNGFWYVNYPDVLTDDWPAPTICVAHNLSIVEGYADGQFRPHQKVNFAEAAKIITKIYGTNSGVQVGEDWYSSGIRALERDGAIPPTINDPFGPITRGELAEILYRLETDLTTASQISYDDLFGEEPLFSENILPAGPNPCNNCIVIPKLDIQVPIVFGEGERELLNGDFDGFEREILSALEDGVVHYPTTALPGDGTGNVFVTGHSSYYADLPGSYKFIFQRLNELNIGDEFHIYYGRQGYGYRVTSEFITDPDDFSVVRQNAGPEIATLMTCWPIYTSKERKIIVAERVQ